MNVRLGSLNASLKQEILITKIVISQLKLLYNQKIY